MSLTRILVWIHDKLLDGELALPKRIIKIALITSVPVIILSTGAVFLGLLNLETHRLLPNWRLGNPILTITAGIADVLIFSPLVETGLSLVPIRLLRISKLPELYIPSICGLFWGLVHIHYHGAILGLVAAWPFYCFTAVLIHFEKPNLDRAWLIASSVHGIHNVFCLTCSYFLSRVST